MQNSFCDEISKRPSIWVERTTITKSATAAAGSGDLHAYRRFKRAETLRQREDEEIFQEKLEHEEFQKRRLENFMKCQEITNKKHEKRLNDKLKLKMKKELKKIEKDAILFNKFANDGSFIHKFQLPKFQEQIELNVNKQDEETKETKETKEISETKETKEIQEKKEIEEQQQQQVNNQEQQQEQNNNDAY